MTVKHHRCVGAVFVLALVFAAAPAHGLDYELNDVQGREISVGVARAPVDSLSIAFLARGSARRQSRYLYSGATLMLGWVLDNRPLAMATGEIGVESASDAFTKVRFYGELGAGLFWAASEKPWLELLTFHAEGGIRWNLRTWARPHWQLATGVRLFANFQAIGLGLFTGVNFKFD